ncbi:MAG TPA: PrsW family glutamic-type intramembrane protease [Candidatus Omnitrophota bacterium]|jgi:RsiW-degrading membrane proteinase PrsW (M82 family)|nr:PrsW family glutamic-type intramembrane protease [Candidatus Omnitrophota bacterium]HPN55816.1 PrsW family glutamic-type intramembrane protease [Candidatus Omnitrophota bacterium]
MHAFFSFIAAVLPALLLVRYFYKANPAPKRFIVKVFLLGVIYTLPVYILEVILARYNMFPRWSFVLYYFFEAFIVAGLCEEYIKLRIIKKYVYGTVFFQGERDGIIFTVVASMGFACMENILYVVNHSWNMALARGFTAVPMHAVCSGVMGYSLGKAKRSQILNRLAEEKKYINQGLWEAILIHGCYDFFLFLSPILGSVFAMFTIPLVLGYYLELRNKMKRMGPEARI